MKERLPDFVLAGLYNDVLVCADEPKQAAIEKVTAPEKLYLGSYNKQIIVLANDENNRYISDESLNFLSGILNACKLNLAHIALINFKNTALHFQQLKTEMQPAFLLLFGISALQIELPFAMPHYQVQQYDQCKILTAPSLTELNQQTQTAKTEKAQLWKSLKKMFDLE